MIDRGKRSVLGISIDVVDYEGAVQRIAAAARDRRGYGVAAMAVHAVMMGALDPEQKYRLNRLQLLTPDGQPVRWALRLLHGEALPHRVYGPDLLLRICERAEREGLSVYFFGGRAEALAALSKNLQRKFPALRIAGLEAPKFRSGTSQETAALDERIRESGADIVFVGLGCPRQEVWTFEHAATLSRPVVAVGAAFDFHAGILRQAPRWMQDRGLEWLFRLWREPRRLWRRYLLLNPLFCLLVAAQLGGVLSLFTREERLPTKVARLV